MSALVIISSTFASKKEIKIVFSVVFFIFMMPLIAVLVIANAGINEISSATATFNPVTHHVNVLDPNGKLVKEIQASTTWPVQGFVSLEFGESDYPYQTHHTGIDIADKIGNPITTFMIGKVVVVQPNPNNPTGYGEYVTIDNGDGISSLYAHMSEITTSVGNEVNPGDVIGLEGITGHTTGPHVHFEIRVGGIPVNPRIFILGNPSRNS
ncbi:MAG: hypothetical protein NVS1B10_08340 [Candidatus Saccharimonadales bacterium]